MSVRESRHGWIYTLAFTIVAIAFISPILIVLFNAFKSNVHISASPFALPSKESFVGLQNFLEGARRTEFVKSFLVSVFITVFSVAVLLLCTSMCAWYITRAQSRVGNLFYILFLFSMIVPFQMVMFTLSKVADTLHLGNPLGIILVYLGFGAGLCVFLFCGFVRMIPLSVEEAAMIDGCSPPQTFFHVVLPILKPNLITVAILESMWIWNDYLLPYLVLDLNEWKTIPIAIQYLKGGYGSIDWGAMMAMLLLAILPIIIFYLICQKHIIAGVVTGAVKG